MPSAPCPPPCTSARTPCPPPHPAATSPSSCCLLCSPLLPNASSAPRPRPSAHPVPSVSACLPPWTGSPQDRPRRSACRGCWTTLGEASLEGWTAWAKAPLCAGHRAGALHMSSFRPCSDLGAGLVETEPPMQGQEIVLSHSWGHRAGGMCTSVRFQVWIWPLHGQNLPLL